MRLLGRLDREQPGRDLGARPSGRRSPHCMLVKTRSMRLGAVDRIR